MGLLKRSGDTESSAYLSLFDPIRKKWVAATPEEKIRQKWISYLTDTLLYPIHLIAVEKELVSLAHHLSSHYAAKGKIPQRRVDVVVFRKKTLQPFLIMEFKATALDETSAAQLKGYNAFIGAPYIVLANESHVLTGSYNLQQKNYSFSPGLPLF